MLFYNLYNIHYTVYNKIVQTHVRIQSAIFADFRLKIEFNYTAFLTMHFLI